MCRGILVFNEDALELSNGKYWLFFFSTGLLRWIRCVSFSLPHKRHTKGEDEEKMSLTKNSTILNLLNSILFPNIVYFFRYHGLQK